MQKNFLIIAAIFFLLEIYVFQAFKTLVSNTYARFAYVAVTVAAYAFLFYEIYTVQRSDRDHHRIHIITVLFLSFLLPKILIALMLLIDDLFRLLQFGYQQFSNAPSHYPERRKFLSVLGFGLAGIW